MKKALSFTLILLMCLMLFTSCINASGKIGDNSMAEGEKTPVESTHNNTSNAESMSVEVWEYSEGESYPEIEDWVKREGATWEEAEKTVLTTDKKTYGVDDIVTLTVTSPYHDAFAFGFNYKVEYYDETAKEWKPTGKDYSYGEVLCMTMGEATEKFKFSDRANDVGEKYRVVWEDFQVNGFLITLISNEFTID